MSWHLAAVWGLLHDTKDTLTNTEIATQTGIAARTARAHTLRLLRQGLLVQHKTFPEHLYQLAPDADKRNPAMYKHLQYLRSVVQARQGLGQQV
jgi:DNA-binding IclR family transcriptional regulator